jgi:hypothetical protein
VRYLLISYLRKMNGQIDEMVNVAKRVRTSDMNNANVILDFADKTIVKCIIEGKQHDTTFDQMRNYYFKVYPQLVEQLEREAHITKEQEKKNSKVKVKTGR